MIQENQPTIKRKQINQKKILNRTEYNLDHKKMEELGPIKLYYCTVFPGFTDGTTGKTVITPEMNFNLFKLNEIEGLELRTIWIKAGEFSHRHLKDIPDPEQIIHRNAYLDKVPNDEWLLILDSDEVLFGAIANIPILLRILESHPEVDYCMISELLPNGELKLRPRLIRKREGMKYGGPNQKHDYIEYYQTLHNGMYPHSGHSDCNYCITNTINYVDVDAVDRSWMLDFLGFFHYKNGWAMELYAQEDIFEIPENMVKLSPQAKDAIDERERRYNIYKEELRD